MRATKECSQQSTLHIDRRLLGELFCEWANEALRSGMYRVEERAALHIVKNHQWDNLNYLRVGLALNVVQR